MENQEYGGFWIRVGATLIDSVMLLLVLAVPLTLIYGSSYWSSPEPVKGVWDILLQYVLPIVLVVWFWTKYLGTPGKLLLRLRVVDARSGQAITTRQAILRYLGYYVSMLPLMLGFIWVAFDRRKQGFHDKIAGTVVLRDTSKEAVRFEQ
jgi:uncharacterized RDD family membrane protein YckC